MAAQPLVPRRFTAIDFETADHGRDSACAVALVKVADGEIVGRVQRLIRPPRQHVMFSWLHGITWERVAGEPAFGEVWGELASWLMDTDCLVAHNAGFDEAVLKACCLAAGLAPPEMRFYCTMVLARRVWDIRPTKLPDVCRRLGIPLKHHDAGSDAEACARIVLAATHQRTGLGVPR